MAIPTPLSPATDDWTDLFNLTVHAVYQSVQEADPWRSCLALMVKYFQIANASIVVQSSSANDPGFAVCIPAGEPFPDLPDGAGHVMGADISTLAGTRICLRLHRLQDAPPFSALDRQRLALFEPHIKQALSLTAHLNCNELQKQIYEEGLARLNIGVILLDESARLLRANPTALQILDSGDGLRLLDGRLTASTAAETRELQRLLACTRQYRRQVTAMCLSRPSGRRKLAAVVRSIAQARSDSGAGPALAIFLRDPDTQAEPARDIARQLFDFTPAEALLAIELLNGLSLDEAAGKLGIQRNTARAHLRAIFSKTGVSRQSELIRVLLNGVLGLSTLDD